MFKCTLENSNGEAFIGRGQTPEEAYKEALCNLNLSEVPSHGPWMWQIKKDESKQ